MSNFRFYQDRETGDVVIVLTRYGEEQSEKDWMVANYFATSRDAVSDLRQSRRLEMMNGSKPCGPSGGLQAPSPKRRRPRLRVSCSPSPQPSPPGEGETFARALVIRPSLVVVCLRNERQRSGDCNRNVRIFQRRASALPLLGERAGEHCHLVKLLIKKSMYIVFTMCFQDGDAKHIHIWSPPLASSHRANPRPDFRRRFLCASSRSRRRLYSRASFDLSCRHAFVASENH